MFHFLILFNWSCNYVALLVLARISLLESYIYITERLQNGLSGKVKTVMKSKAVSFPVVTRVPFSSGPHISAPTDQVWIYSPRLDVSCAS